MSKHPWLWDLNNLDVCEKTSCFLRQRMGDSRKGRIQSSLQSTKGRAAFEALKEHLVKQSDFPVHNFRRQSYVRPSFANCSFIGGSPSSSKKSYSKIIDSGPTIRLNRRYPAFLRAEGVPTFLGSRTDVLVLQRATLKTIGRYIKKLGGGNNTLEYSRFLAGESFFKEKPLLLYRSRCFDARACTEALEILNNSTIPGRLPFRLIHQDIEKSAVASLKRFGQHKVPSTGIVGILVALRMCKVINVFAMNGSTKGDGDFPKRTVWNGHDLSVERKFVRWLGTCRPHENPWCGRVKVFS